MQPQPPSPKGIRCSRWAFRSPQTPPRPATSAHSLSKVRRGRCIVCNFEGQVANHPLGSGEIVCSADMELVVEASDTPISIVKFARHSSDLLAMGDEAGIVRIIQLAAGTKVIQVMPRCKHLSAFRFAHLNSPNPQLTANASPSTFGSGDSGAQCWGFRPGLVHYKHCHTHMLRRRHDCAVGLRCTRVELLADP